MSKKKPKIILKADDEMWCEVARYKVKKGFLNSNDAVTDLIKKGLLSDNN